MNTSLTVSSLFVIIALLMSSPYAYSQSSNSDCVAATTLCGDSDFSFSAGINAGQVEELSDADGLCLSAEFASNWLEWTIAEAGTLTFVLTPEDDFADLDFVLYRVTGEICEEQEAIRCMASGETAGQNSELCQGATGLALGETDTSEDPGCDNNSNNFLAPVETQVGERYVLLVVNFTQTGPIDIALEFSGPSLVSCDGSTSVDELSSKNNLFTINQSLNQIDLQLNEPSTEGAHFDIYNHLGQNITSNTALSDRRIIDLSSFSTGQYLIRVRQGNRTETKSFVVVK